jgi:hypothetical protein
MRYTSLRFVVFPRLLIAAAVTLAGLLGPAAAALADNQNSSNWSGYAVHGPGRHFRQASGEWRVPKVDCSSGLTTYSAMWVGLGGFSTTSNVIEQTGTEADCAGHRPHYWAWYELVPAASHTLSVRVGPGDLMRAVVVVRGRRVTLTLADLTRHRRFSRAFTPAKTDTSSAEWILEAPLDCSSNPLCVTLPLSNFHRAAFSVARVVTTPGKTGTIAGAHWTATRITLGWSPATGGATPGGLSAAGSAFSLSYVAPPPPDVVRPAARSGLLHKVRVQGAGVGVAVGQRPGRVVEPRAQPAHRHALGGGDVAQRDHRPRAA